MIGIVGDVSIGNLSIQDILAKLVGAVEEREKGPSRFGEIRHFDEQRRYGFIVPDDGGVRVFFHNSVVQGRPEIGQRVEFDAEQGDKGLRATIVRLSFFSPPDDPN